MIYTLRIETGTDCNPLCEVDRPSDAAALRYAAHPDGDGRAVTVFRGTERQVCAGNARKVGVVPATVATVTP